MDERYLELMNVMSHTHTVIPFDKIRAACIQGVNGAGKSAIPDAILLALFGECSRGKGPDLVRLGETEMSVVYRFEQSGHLYQIVRKWSLNGRGKTAVELSEHNGGTPPLDWELIATGEEAKKKILDLLRRDFDSFTSSSFLLQGQGEKLITSKATERYKIVFDILGLNKYEDFRTKAVKIKNVLSGQKEALESDAEKLRTRAATMPKFVADKETADILLASIRKDLSEKEGSLSGKSSEAAVLQSRIAETEGIRAELVKTEAQRGSLSFQLKEMEKTLRPLSPELEKEVVPLLDKISTEEAVSKLAVLSVQLEGFKQLDAELVKTEAERGSLSFQLEEMEKTLRPLSPELEKEVVPLLDKISTEEAVSKLAVLSAQLEGFKQLDAEISSLSSRKPALIARKQEVEELLGVQKKILDNKERILAFVGEEKAKTGELAALKVELESLEREVESTNASLKRALELDAQIATLQASVDLKDKEKENSVRTARSNLQAARKDVELLGGTVCKGEGEREGVPFGSCGFIAKAVESKSSIATLEKEIEELSKTVESEEKVRLASFLKEKETLGSAALDKTLSVAKGRIAQIKESIKTLESRLSALRTWTEKASQIDSADGEVRRLEAQSAEIGRDVADIDSKVKDLMTRKAGETTLRWEISILQAVVERLRFQTESRDLRSKVESADALIADLMTRKAGEATLRWEISILQAVVERLRFQTDSRDLRSKVESADALIAEIRKKLTDYEGLQITLRTLRGEIDTMRAYIAALKEKENRTFSEVMRLEGEIRNCLTDEATAVEKQREIDALALRIRAFEFLEEAYEKIPFLILDNVIEIMEEEANRVLEEISTSGMRIELRTEKQNKNGKGAKDALDIIVSDVAGERRIELYSGGEKTRQILALAVGLAELSARKAGVKIETLLIDEPAGLDAQGLTDFGRCFIQLVDSGMFKKGILIAHESILKDVFEQKIIVTKEGTTSHVEITT